MKGIRTLVAMVLVGLVAALVGGSQLLANDQPVAPLVPVETDNQLGGITRLRGFEEVPAISSPGDGLFDIFIVNDMTVNYRLNYSGTQGNVQQAHVHFGQQGVNGGIVVFLCSNLGNGPVGTQLCPPSGQIAGSFNAASVGNGAAGQGIAAGELSEFLRAIRAGVTYANVHTDQFPGGEIRGQLRFVGDGPHSAPNSSPGTAGGPAGPGAAPVEIAPASGGGGGSAPAGGGSGTGAAGGGGGPG